MANTTHDAGHAAAEAGGMPQLDPAAFGTQIFWLVVTLVVIYFVLTKIALPRIERFWLNASPPSRMTSPRPRS